MLFKLFNHFIYGSIYVVYIVFIEVTYASAASYVCNDANMQFIRQTVFGCNACAFVTYYNIFVCPKRNVS